VTAGFQWFRKASPSLWPMTLLGLSLLYSMARVYLLRAVPSWNSWRTPVTFFLSATVLGALGINLTSPNPGWAIVVGLAMSVEMGLMLTAQSDAFNSTGRLRIVLLGLGIIGTLLVVILPQASGLWLAIPLFLIGLTAEVIGRWQFFTSRMPFPFSAD
jgi:DMSO reductase anchor subunit